MILAILQEMWYVITYISVPSGVWRLHCVIMVEILSCDLYDNETFYNVLIFTVLRPLIFII